MARDPVEAAVTWLGQHALPCLLGALLALLLTSALAWAALRHVHVRGRAGRLSPFAFLALRLGSGFVVLVAAGALFAEMAEALHAGESMGRFDSALARSLALNMAPVALGFFAKFTHLADANVQTGITLAVAVALLLVGRRWLALGWVAACGGNGLLNTSLKHLFVRARPPHDHGFATADGFSFPSGHSSGAVVIYGMLAYIGLRLLPERWHLPVVLLAAGLAFTIGCSRVLLQVHWASDVLAGFASGSAWLVVCVFSIEALRHYREKSSRRPPVEPA